MAESSTERKKEDVKVNKNLFVYIIIGLIIVTFVISAGVIPGIMNFVNELFQKREINPDGTISIERMAQTKENGNNPDTYIGKVLGRKIQFGHDDNFNRQYENIVNNPNFNGYQKYQYIRYVYDNEIERIIGMYNAKRMNITVSNKSVLKIIAKTQYADSDGEIDYDRLRADMNRINLKDSEQIRNELLLENYEYDYFGHLPVAESEVVYRYKADNTKVKIKYFDVAFDNISTVVLNQYLNENKERFKRYKIGKIVFSESNKKDAERALIELVMDPSKFDEISNHLQTENKIINTISDSEYRFVDEYDVEIGAIVASTELGKVGNKLVMDSNIGYSIVKVLDTQSANIANDDVLAKVKEAYVRENKAVAELETQKKANEIYERLPQTKNFEELAVVHGAKLVAPEEEYRISDNIFSMLSYDNTADRNYITKLFFLEEGKSTAPYRYSNGYIVGYLEERMEADISDLENDYEKQVKNIDDRKVNELKYDFYREQKKKYKVVDNFQYVIKIQDFFNMNQGTNEF